MPVATKIRIAGIDQRGDQFLPGADRDPLVGDEVVEHASQIAALFASQDRGDVNLGKHALLVERLGERRAFADAVADVEQHRAQARRRSAFGEQIQRLQNRQTGLDDRIELLIEDQEIGGAHPAGPVAAHGTQPRSRLAG